MRFRGLHAFIVLVAVLVGMLGSPRVAVAATKAEVERAERLANEGDPGAQVGFGIMHELGDGVPQNATEASKWFRRAAEQGDADGAFRLGWLYARGEGLPQNYEQAAHWYEIAAGKGHDTAQLSLGWLYLNGQGVARDVPQAITWFTRAADGGDPNAQYTLGMIHAGAYEGVKKDPAAAARWFEVAAVRGMAGAQARLGSLLANGDSGKVDAAGAYFWLSIAVTQLPEGAFKTETAAAREKAGASLGTGERADLDKRVSAWKPGMSGP